MAELISAYKPSCCNKAYMRKSSAVRHEKKCPKNPENRACETCEHRIETTETYYNPYHNGDCGSADYDYKYWWCEVHEKKIDVYSNSNGGTTILPKMNCVHWERTPKERGTDKPKVTCLNCKHLMFSDMYGECNKQLRIVNPSDTCEYAEPKERGGEKRVTIFHSK